MVAGAGAAQQRACAYRADPPNVEEIEIIDTIHARRAPMIPASAGLAHPRSGHALTWPPGRNDACWCQSARKYKRCCGKG